MISITIQELHEHTDVWVRKAAGQEPIVVTDGGRTVARILPMPAEPELSPSRARSILPGFVELQARMQGGTDSSDIVSDMRDGR